MPWSTPSSGRSKLLFWSLLALAIVMILAVAFALRGFNREMATETGTDVSSAPASTETPSDVKNAPMPDGLATPQEKSLSGFVSEVISKTDSPEKWIVLSVELPKSVPTAMPSKTAAQTSIPVETVTRSYRFYLGAEVKGVGDIQGGETANVSFFGEPSEKDYVGAETIAIREK